MLDPGLLRFLELVMRELEADDARIELGGRAPTDPRIVFRAAPSGGRIVAIFREAPENRPTVESKLATLVESFFAVAEHAPSSLPSIRTPIDVAQKRLDEELSVLRERASATAVAVIDVESPMVWGVAANAPRLEMRFQDALATIRDVRAELSAGHTARLSMTNGVECLARPFATQYIVALLFDGPVSEPTAMGALLHALPAIERLVLALPPVDPPRGGAKIMRMPARLR